MKADLGRWTSNLNIGGHHYHLQILQPWLPRSTPKRDPDHQVNSRCCHSGLYRLHRPCEPLGCRDMSCIIIYQIIKSKIKFCLVVPLVVWYFWKICKRWPLKLEPPKVEKSKDLRGPRDFCLRVHVIGEPHKAGASRWAPEMTIGLFHGSLGYPQISQSLFAHGEATTWARGYNSHLPWLFVSAIELWHFRCFVVFTVEPHRSGLGCCPSDSMM